MKRTITWHTNGAWMTQWCKIATSQKSTMSRIQECEIHSMLCWQPQPFFILSFSQGTNTIFFCILWIQQWVLKIILGWFSFQRGDPSHILVGEVQSLRRRFPRIHSFDCCRGLPCFHLCPTTSIHHSFWGMVNILCKKFHIFAILLLHLLLIIRSNHFFMSFSGLDWADPSFWADSFHRNVCLCLHQRFQENPDVFLGLPARITCLFPVLLSSALTSWHWSLLRPSQCPH